MERERDPEPGTGLRLRRELRRLDLDGLLARLEGGSSLEQVVVLLLIAEQGKRSAPAVDAVAHALANGGGRLVHWAAAHALGSIGPDAAAATEVLEQASLGDPSPDVRAEAAEALRRIHGAPAGVC